MDSLVNIRFLIVLDYKWPILSNRASVTGTVLIVSDATSFNPSTRLAGQWNFVVESLIFCQLRVFDQLRKVPRLTINCLNALLPEHVLLYSQTRLSMCQFCICINFKNLYDSNSFLKVQFKVKVFLAVCNLKN